MLKEKYYGFKELNKRSLERACAPKGDSTPMFKFNETWRERFKPTGLPNIANELSIKRA